MTNPWPGVEVFEDDVDARIALNAKVHEQRALRTENERVISAAFYNAAYEDWLHEQHIFNM